MTIKRDTKTSISIKQAYVEMGTLVDVETGESIDIPSLIEKIYGDAEVKISIAASSTEDIEPSVAIEE